LQDPERLLDEDQRRWIERPGPQMRRLGRVLGQLNRMIMTGLFGLRAEGLDRLPRRGPFVLVANHPSYLDPLAMAAALPRGHLAETYWAGWTGIMFRNRVMRVISRAMQVMPIDPRRSPLASLAFGAATLRRGRVLVWFPEGQRSATEAMGKFEPGIGLILAAQPVPAVPAWLAGTHRALPRGRCLPRLRPIRVIFGDPIPADRLREAAGDGRHEGIVELLREHLVRLAAERSPGAPPEASSEATR
jgi:long-chain acyl-CoA synthetase